MLFAPIENKCNLNCVNCGKMSFRRSGSEIQLGAFSVFLANHASTNMDVCFTGGEPTINKSLPAFIRLARTHGVKRIGIETNAIVLSYREYLNTLSQAGVDYYRINVLEIEENKFEDASRTPGAFMNFEQGIANVLEIADEVYAVISVSSYHFRMGKLIEYLRDKGFKRVVLKASFDNSIDDCDSKTTGALEYRSILSSMIPILLSSGISVMVEDCPHCAVISRDFIPEMFIRGNDYVLGGDCMSVSGNRQFLGNIIPGKCGQCLYAESCVGLSGKYLELSGDNGLLPTTIQTALNRGVEGEAADLIVRINSDCNQKCLFCWVDKKEFELGYLEIIDGIRGFSAAGIINISISGGEPTIHPRFFDFLSEITNLKFKKIALQTNAIKCASPDFVARLAVAGVTHAFVSFHSHNPEVSDRITSAKGTFDKTVKGIKNLTASGIMVALNIVINALNFKELADTIRFIEKEFFASKSNIQISFSFVAPMGGFDKADAWVVPRYTEVAPFLIEALDVCNYLGVNHMNLAGQCGIPLCVLGGHEKYFPDMQRIELGEQESSFLMTESCEACDLRANCYGLRKGYAAIHGASELAPITLEKPKTQKN